MNPCVTCGHALRHHASLNLVDDCAIPGCTCTRFEAMPATTPVRVRCAGHPGTTPPCTWTSTTTLGDPADDGHCPNCDGLVEEVPATTPTVADTVASPPPDLQQAIQARADRAHDEIGAICKEGPRRWRMSIPAQPDRDSDLIIADALADIPRLLEQLQAAQAENQQLRDVLKRSTTIHAADQNGGCTFCTGFPDHAHCWYCGIREPNHLNDCLIAATLEQRAGLGRVIGYQTSDGCLYAPEDITIIHHAALGQVERAKEHP